MSCSIILKKEEHWYILPDTEDRAVLILSLVEKENPEIAAAGENISDILSKNGWSIEEYQDFAIVA